MQLSLLYTFLPSVALRMTVRHTLSAFYGVLKVCIEVNMQIRSDYYFKDIYYKVDTQMRSDWVSAYPPIVRGRLKWQGILYSSRNKRPEGVTKTSTSDPWNAQTAECLEISEPCNSQALGCLQNSDPPKYRYYDKLLVRLATSLLGEHQMWRTLALWLNFFRLQKIN